MNYKTIQLPEDFIAEVKQYADKESRSIPQQLLYWARLGKEISQSYFVDDDDDILGKLALKKYNKEKHLAIKVSLDEL